MKKLILLTLILGGCSHGPTQEHKSPLNVLNGEHYGSTLTVGPVPVMVNQYAKETKITGHIEAFDSFSKLPRKAEVKLLKNNNVLLTTTTTSAGNFSFKTELLNGEYSLVARGDQMSGKVNFLVDKYEVDNLIIIMKEAK